MEYGICNVAIAPLRAEAKEQSEMVSQVLFGETFEIQEWQDNWVKIVTAYDNYSGWIGRLLFETLPESDFKQHAEAPSMLTNSAVTWAFKKVDMGLLYLPFGCTLPNINLHECRVGSEHYLVPEMDTEPDDSIKDTAMLFINSPYLWGGRTHFGIDCSGFTQAVFKLHGIKIDRDASQQVKQGTLIENLTDAQAGDLAFFENKDRKITHVGIMLDEGQIIHASGKVKIDTLNEQGIYSEDQERHTHRFNCLRRYF